MSSFQTKVNMEMLPPKHRLRITAYKINKATGEISSNWYMAESATCSAGNVQRGPGSVVTGNPDEHLTVSASPGHSQKIHVESVVSNRNEWVQVGKDERVIHIVGVSQPR
jgi:hypothetical protein